MKRFFLCHALIISFLADSETAKSSITGRKKWSIFRPGVGNISEDLCGCLIRRFRDENSSHPGISKAHSVYLRLTKTLRQPPDYSFFSGILIVTFFTKPVTKCLSVRLRVWRETGQFDRQACRQHKDRSWMNGQTNN